MRAEIVSIGTELLIGSVLNTHARFLSQKLAQNAIDVYYHTVVGDNLSRIIDALERAILRSDIVITTGGLGPTEDDVTVEAISSFLERKRALHQPTYDYILKKVKVRGCAMKNLMARQCYLPEKAMVLKNHDGTAPGLILKSAVGGRAVWIMVLPGPPRELEPMFVRQALPALIRKARIKKEHFVMRSVKIACVTEAEVARKVTDLLKMAPPLTVGIYAKPSEVELKIMAKHSSKKKAVGMAGQIERVIRRRLKQKVYGTDDDTLASVVGARLRQLRKNLAVAESCTGGYLSHLVTSVPGSSDYFKGSVVAYRNDVKGSILGIPRPVLARHGAVSPAVARQLARNTRTALGADIGVGVSGIAGPTGGSRKKPVGLVYIALATEKRAWVTKNFFFGKRPDIIAAAANKALDLLRRFITPYSKI